MKMHEVTSTNITRIGWEEDNLAVDFSNGTSYMYQGVPREVYDQMLTAPSIGSFLAREIKGRYAYQRLTETV